MAPWTGVSPSQSVERTDGTRTGTDTWQQASAASVKIISTAHDTHDQDVADMINACLKKDGGNAATANIPMGGFSLTSVGGLTLSSGAVLSWSSGDVTVTHSTNALAFAGASSGYSFDDDILLPSAGVINWNSGDVTITHSANALAFAGATSGYSFDDDILLPTSGVINFNSGDVTVTHSANALAFAGATSGYSFDDDILLVEGAVINWDGGDVTLTQSGNSLTVAGGNLIFPGTATNDSASAGQVGEYMSSTIASGSAVSLSDGVAADVTSLNLTAGDWDINGKVAFTINGATVLTSALVSTNTSSATHGADTSPTYIRSYTDGTAGNTMAMATGVARVTIASPTTVYLVVTASFSVNTCAAYGIFRARRVR
jgi:hypothetical protein